MHTVSDRKRTSEKTSNIEECVDTEIKKQEEYLYQSKKKLTIAANKKDNKCTTILENLRNKTWKKRVKWLCSSAKLSTLHLI